MTSEEIIAHYQIPEESLDKVRKRVEKEYGASVNQKGQNIRITYPLDNFSLRIGGLPQIMNLLSIRKAKIIDLEFPKHLEKEFTGPKFGLEGIRKLLKTSNNRRPHIGMRIDYYKKQNPEQIAQKVYDYGSEGINFFTDDRDLVNQKFCPLEERAAKIREKTDLIKSEKGRTVLYAINITTRADKILHAADDALDAGANMLMLDVTHGNFSGINAIAEDPSIKTPLHVQISDAIPPNVSELLVTKLARISGGDQVFINPQKKLIKTLLEEKSFQKSLPIVSGELNLVKKLGNELGVKVAPKSAEEVKKIREKQVKMNIS